MITKKNLNDVLVVLSGMHRLTDVTREECVAVGHALTAVFHKYHNQRYWMPETETSHVELRRLSQILSMMRIRFPQYHNPITRLEFLAIEARYEEKQA